MFEGQSPRSRSFYDGADFHPYRSWIDGPNGLPNDGNVHSEPGLSTFHSFSKFVRLYDFKNRKGQDGQRPVAPCSHLRIAQRFTNAMPAHVKCQGGYQYQMFPSSFDRPHIAPINVIDNLPVLPTAPIFEAGLKAFNKFNSQIPLSVSIVNFLYEFREYKDMVPKFTKKLRSIPHAANSNLLSYKFGWEPFIGDMAKLSGLYKKIIDRIDYLRKTQKKIVPVRYKQLDVYDYPDIGSYTPWWVYNGWSSGGEEYFRGKLIDAHADFYASCKLYHDLKGLDDHWAYLKALSASLGVNNPVSIVWNAIPFSFVLDWFLPIGNMLENLAINPFEGVWRFWDCTYSVKQTISYDISHFYSGGPCGVGDKDDFMSRVDVVSYERKLGLPTLLSDLSDLTLEKQALLASLAFNFTEHKQRPHKGAKRK